VDTLDIAAIVIGLGEIGLEMIIEYLSIDNISVAEVRELDRQE
jgi:hypothetical protein